MEILGTNFSITLGSWRFALRFAVEDVDAPVRTKDVPHRMRVVRDDAFSHREA